MTGVHMATNLSTRDTGPGERQVSTWLQTLVPGTQDQGNEMTGVYKVQTLVSGTQDQGNQMTGVHMATDLRTWDTGPGE